MSQQILCLKLRRLDHFKTPVFTGVLGLQTMFILDFKNELGNIWSTHDWGHIGNLSKIEWNFRYLKLDCKQQESSYKHISAAHRDEGFWNFWHVHKWYGRVWHGFCSWDWQLLFALQQNIYLYWGVGVYGITACRIARVFFSPQPWKGGERNSGAATGSLQRAWWLNISVELLIHAKKYGCFLKYNFYLFFMLMIISSVFKCFP